MHSLSRSSHISGTTTGVQNTLKGSTYLTFDVSRMPK